MISTLKRTLTDIMEDELYTMPNSQSHSSTCAQQVSQLHQQQQQQRERSQSQNSSNIDLNQYLHLNGSQDSMLQSIQALDDPRQYSSIDSNLINNQNIQSLPSPSRQLDHIYNSYANPSLFANSVFPDELQPNNYSHATPNPYSDRSNSMASNHDVPFNPSNKVYSNEGEEEDDVVVIPQDNYYIYDHANSDQQSLLPELLQFNISSKPLNPSNELNIFKPDFYIEEEEFSEEDEEDDDNPNKLDDMEMDLDDMSSESSFGGDLDDEDYFKTENDQNDQNDQNQHQNQNQNQNSGVSDGINSLYSLPEPAQTINPRDLISCGFQQFGFSNFNEKPNMMMPNTENLYIESDIDENEDAIMDDNDDELSGEEEDDDDEDDELYTPAFEQRRESVLTQQKPTLVNTKKSPLPQIHSPTLRKLKSSTETLQSNSFPSTSSNSSANGEDDDDHVCLINNPKTGLPCNKKFSRPYDLIRHQNTIHATKRSYYRCMFCEDDLRRKNSLEPNNEIVIDANYRNSTESLENSNSNNANSHITKKLKNSAGCGLNTKNGEFFSNKTFSRCDALTRHLRFRHGLNNQQVSDSMEFAKKNVEFYEN